MVVDDKIAKMEAAAEADMEEHEKKRPAVQKLRFLAEIEEFLAQVIITYNILPGNLDHLRVFPGNVLKTINHAEEVP